MRAYSGSAGHAMTVVITIPRAPPSRSIPRATELHFAALRRPFRCCAVPQPAALLSTGPSRPMQAAPDPARRKESPTKLENFVGSLGGEGQSHSFFVGSLRAPHTGIATCCARTASGQAAAAPPIFGPLADVHFTAESDRLLRRRKMTLSAKRSPERVQQNSPCKLTTRSHGRRASSVGWNF